MLFSLPLYLALSLSVSFSRILFHFIIPTANALFELNFEVPGIPRARTQQMPLNATIIMHNGYAYEFVCTFEGRVIFCSSQNVSLPMIAFHMENV